MSIGPQVVIRVDGLEACTDAFRRLAHAAGEAGQAVGRLSVVVRDTPELALSLRWRMVAALCGIVGYPLVVALLFWLGR